MVQFQYNVPFDFVGGANPHTLYTATPITGHPNIETFVKVQVTGFPVTTCQFISGSVIGFSIDFNFVENHPYTVTFLPPTSFGINYLFSP